MPTRLPCTNRKNSIKERTHVSSKNPRERILIDANLLTTDSRFIYGCIFAALLLKNFVLIAHWVVSASANRENLLLQNSVLQSIKLLIGPGCGNNTSSTMNHVARRGYSC
jgi:hypothetical protein